VSGETAGGERPALPQVEIYADGACSGNPGPGGWGAVLLDRARGRRQEISGFEPATTNNRMELTAIIQALQRLRLPSRVRVTTDSLYVVQGMKEWIITWQKNGWKTFGRKPVKNRELWEELLRLEKVHELSFHWIEGHAGHPENERCDQLAVEQYRQHG
jgi:ribonuclease HI